MKRLKTMTLASVWLLAACQGEGKRDLPKLTDDTPLPLVDALFYEATSDDGDSVALLADLSGRRPEARGVLLPEGSVTALSRPGSAQSEVLVLTGGARARREDGEIRPEVSSYVLRFDRDGEIARTALGGRFGALAASDDGRYAVAHAPAGGLTNDVALVDLTREGDDAARRVTLRLLDGEPPSSFVFVNAGARRLLVARMPRSLSVLDLGQLDADEPDVLVPLDGVSSQSASKVLASDDTLFVQSAGAREVLMLQLEDAEGGRGFRVTPLRLATTTIVDDIALVGRAQSLRVLAVGGGRASLLEPLTGAGQELVVPTNLQRIVLFEAAAPNDDQVRQRALLVGTGNALAFLDIGDDRTLGSEGLEVLPVSQGVRDVLPVADLGLAVLVHTNGSFSVLDLAQRTISRLSAAITQAAPQLDVGGDHARLWYALDSGALGVIDLVTRQPAEILFASNVSAVVPLGGDEDRIAAVTDSVYGSVAVLSGDELGEGVSAEMAGFTWSGFLD